MQIKENEENFKEIGLRESQLATLEVFKKFDSICKQNNFKYFIIFGTLIGAVRHHGFIPWDDDFDVAMPREDYNNFLTYCDKHKNELTPLYEIHNKNTLEKCPFNLTRFCCNDYKLVFQIWDGYESGLFIDIYPIDGMGKKKDSMYWKFFSIMNYLLQKKATLSYLTNSFIGRNRCNKYFNVLFSFLFVHKNTKIYWNRLDKVGQKFSWNKSDYAYCTTWTGAKKIPKFKKEIFENLIELDFEGLKVPAPKDYDMFLRQIYGNYLELPSIELQKPQHGYKVYKLIK